MVDYGPLYQAAAGQYGLDPLLLQTLAEHESHQDPNAVGPVITRGPAAGQHALGIMQFIPTTAAEYDVAYPMSPVQSVYGAANYMDTLLKNHGGNLRAALAEYSGNGGNVNAPYVKDVMDRYTGLSRAWSATGPSAAGPTTDTDPESPTTGSATYANLQRPGGPGDLTTAKGNPGQPAPSVPTTDKGVSYATSPSTTFAPPGQGGPKGQRTDAAPTPDYLHDAPAPGTAPAAAPAAPAVSSGPDYLHDAPQQVDADGNPIKPMDTGQYLTSATSPGAMSVGSSAEISEGREPGPAVQAAVNLATDPAQRARIAASQLNIPLDRIVIGQGNRLAAVDDKGQRYYIDPPPVFADQGGLTKAPRGSIWPTVSDEDWHPIGAAQVTPYSRAAPLGPGATASNIPLAMGGAIPSTVQNYLTMAPAAIGGPVMGGILTAAASQAAQSGRQWLANRFDPDQAAAPSPAPTPESLRNALFAGAGVTGLRVGGALLAPEIAAYSAKGEPGAPSTALKSSLGSEVPLQFPLGEAGGARAPWENPLIRPSETPKPTGPAEPLPPGTGGVPAPAGEAAEARGPIDPYAASTSTPEEIAAIPHRPPSYLTPVLTRAQAEARADELFRAYAAGGSTAVDTRELVPGSKGTMTQLTDNAGLATLERIMRTDSMAVNVFNARDVAQQAAQRDFAAKQIGTPDDIARIEADAQAATTASRNAAFANKTATDASAPVDAIDEILAGPEGKRSQVATPLRLLRRGFFETDPDTGKLVMESDPEMLYGVRKSITDALGPLARGTESYAGAAASLIRSKILPALDDAIEAGAPGFKDYLAQYHDMMQPADAMRYLQSRNITDATTGSPLLKPIDTMLKDIQKQRTLQPGIRPADALSDDQITAFENLRDDLRRRASLTKGRVPGPGTAQELLGNQMLNALTRPTAQEVGKVAAAFGGPIAYGVTAGAEHLMARGVGATQQWVRDALIKRLLNVDNAGVRALTPAAGAAP